MYLVQITVSPKVNWTWKRTETLIFRRTRVQWAFTPSQTNRTNRWNAPEFDENRPNIIVVEHGEPHIDMMEVFFHEKYKNSKHRTPAWTSLCMNEPSATNWINPYSCFYKTFRNLSRDSCWSWNIRLEILTRAENKQTNRIQVVAICSCLASGLSYHIQSQTLHLTSSSLLCTGAVFHVAARRSKWAVKCPLLKGTLRCSDKTYERCMNAGLFGRLLLLDYVLNCRVCHYSHSKHHVLSLD